MGSKSPLANLFDISECPSAEYTIFMLFQWYRFTMALISRASSLKRNPTRVSSGYSDPSPKSCAIPPGLMTGVSHVGAYRATGARLWITCHAHCFGVTTYVQLHYNVKLNSHCSPRRVLSVYLSNAFQNSSMKLLHVIIIILIKNMRLQKHMGTLETRIH